MRRGINKRLDRAERLMLQLSEALDGVTHLGERLSSELRQFYEIQSATHNNPEAIRLYNAAGRLVVEIGADDQGNGILALNDRLGILAVIASATPGGGRISIADAGGEPVGALQACGPRGEVALAAPSGGRIITGE
ncbi:MAG: hypothetical protein HY718_04185 [Planctomycetes bacterium]|nr:hypothetical protein [Planctomycetota bacterium]